MLHHLIYDFIGAATKIVIMLANNLLAQMFMLHYLFMSIYALNDANFIFNSLTTFVLCNHGKITILVNLFTFNNKVTSFGILS